jgi:crotonobetainyl-CoA:carnitine CoA-transferase CaiB-like acyl-CoA transferase
MSIGKEKDSALAPYRILDLTEGGCMLGARILGDLGADVIKIEPPRGSPSRIPPFFKDSPHPEKSLFWFVYNLNKKGITLDLSKTAGQGIFKRLVESADMVMESFRPGHLDRLGLSYTDLIKTKPDIILTSISPFGQNGPKAHYKGSDLTAWASGGYLYSCGDPDRAPSGISFPQAEFHAGAEAASGTMVALWHRRRSGEGQHVDVSMQECVIACNFSIPEKWDLNKTEFMRFARGVKLEREDLCLNTLWECKDGYVVALVTAGSPELHRASMEKLIEWMDEESMADDWLKRLNPAVDCDSSRVTLDTVRRMEEAFIKFFKTKSKIELYEEGALKRSILLGPVDTTEDVYKNVQLKSRDFWVEVKHPELGDDLTYPGPFAKISENQIAYQHRAPLIGEHNIEIYHQELGLSMEDLFRLKQTMVI